MSKTLQGRTSTRSSWLVVLVCFLAMVLEGYDIQAFGIAAPGLTKALHLGPAQQGWAASAAMFGLMAGAFFFGWVSDLAGRKPVLLFAMVAFGTGSVWTGFSHEYSTIVTARLVTGLGFGGAMPTLIAIATEISPVSRRGAATSAMFCGMPVGGTIVAILAKSIGVAADWHTLFLIGGALPLLFLPIVAATLPETRPTSETGADRRLLHALFGAGRAEPTLLLWAGNLLTLAAMYLLLNWLPTLVVSQSHTATDGAAAAAAFNMVGVAGALLLGVLADFTGVRWLLSIAYIALAAAIVMLARSTAMQQILIFSAATGFLILGIQYVLYALAPRIYAPPVRAAGAGAAVAIGRFGAIAGPLAAGQLRQAGWTSDQVFLAVAPVIVAAGVCVFILTTRMRSV